MRIEDLTPGLGVTFYVNIINEQQMTFETIITEVNLKKHLIIAEAIIKEDKVLSFKSKKGISVDMVVAIPDEKPVLFQNISLETLKFAENSFGYNIGSSKEGIPYNRRNSFRCFIGNPTYLKGGRNLEEHSVILRDVSATGFSVTCGPEVELEIDQLVHVLLEDYIEETDRNYSFHLFGLTVRKQDLENGKFIYGFRLNNHVGGLENYLTQKQRIQLRKMHGTE